MSATEDHTTTGREGKGGGDGGFIHVGVGSRWVGFLGLLVGILCCLTTPTVTHPASSFSRPVPDLFLEV